MFPFELARFLSLLGVFSFPLALLLDHYGIFPINLAFLPPLLGVFPFMPALLLDICGVFLFKLAFFHHYWVWYPPCEPP